MKFALVLFIIAILILPLLLHHAAGGVGQIKKPGRGFIPSPLPSVILYVLIFWYFYSLPGQAAIARFNAASPPAPVKNAMT
jgi:hypothetical protein